MDFYKVTMVLPRTDKRSLFFIAAKDKQTADDYLADRFKLLIPEYYEDIKPDEEIEKWKASVANAYELLGASNRTYSSLNASANLMADLRKHMTKELEPYQVSFQADGKRKRVALCARSEYHAKQLILETGVECKDLFAKKINPIGQMNFLNGQIRRMKEHIDMLRKKIDRYREMIRDLEGIKEAAKSYKEVVLQ